MAEKKVYKANAKVLRVLDGDTIEVAVKIRFAKIDAPETKGVEKPLGDIAKEWLTDKLEGKVVELDIEGNDIYKRLLSRVFLKQEDIGDEMLQDKLVEIYTPKHHNNGVLDI
jgi:endonuclease YncB( thermonuclease family)